MTFSLICSMEVTPHPIKQLFGTKPKMRSYTIGIPILLSVLLSGCEFEIPFEVDLSVVEKVDRAPGEGQRFSMALRPTISDRFFGAPSKSGSPFVVDICTNSEIYDSELPRLIEIKLLKEEAGKRSSFASMKLDEEWTNRGAVSCVIDAARIEKAVGDPIRVFIDVLYLADGLERNEVHMFEIRREMGKRTMTLEDILGQ